jgi:hypothetical protein
MATIAASHPCPHVTRRQIKIIVDYYALGWPESELLAELHQ